MAGKGNNEMMFMLPCFVCSIWSMLKIQVGFRGILNAHELHAIFNATCCDGLNLHKTSVSDEQIYVWLHTNNKQITRVLFLQFSFQAFS